MTQHTGRDNVWDIAIRLGMTEESFQIGDVIETDSVDLSKRTVRDTMKTMADMGWLEKQSPGGEQWEPGPLLTGEKDPANQPKDGIPVDEFDGVSDLAEGEVYVGTVGKVSSNALIWLDEPGGQHINLGPIDQAAVGETVRFEKMGGVWGKCLDEEYTYRGYHPKDGRSSSSSSSSSSPTSYQGSRKSGPSPGGKNPRTKTSVTDGTITEKDPENKNKLLKGNQ